MGAGAGARTVATELGAAVTYLTVGMRPWIALDVLARGGAFFPLIGLLLGGSVWALDFAATSAVGPQAAAALAVLALASLGRGSLPAGLAGAVASVVSRRDRTAASRPGAAARGVGVAVALGSAGVKWWALTVTPPEAQTLSLPLAVMLGRWAFVVQAYGSQAARPVGLGASLARALQFREFGIASVSAMALTLVLANAIGLVLILWTATQTVAVRIFAHSRSGGVGERSLAAGAELAELSTLLLCAGLARAIVAG